MVSKTDKALIGFTIINVLVCAYVLLVHSHVKYVPTAEAAVQQTCPAGSYEIGRKEPGGDPICKLEPTGCPYGDSIPLGPDCDKHAPQPEPVQEYYPIEPVELMQGK